MAHGLTRASVFIAATTLLLATSSALGDDRPAPGAYEITTATTYTDVPLPDTTFTTTSCLTAEDLNRDPASALTVQPEGQNCSLAEFVMDGGEIEMRVVCDTEASSMVMVTSGTYDTNGWHMISDVTVTVGTDQVKMHATVDGRRTGDC